MKFRLWAAAAMLASLASTARCGDYIDKLIAAEPEAAAMLSKSARDWRAASSAAKDRTGFFIMAQDFEGKNKVSINDIERCMDVEAPQAAPEAMMMTVIRQCIMKIVADWDGSHDPAPKIAAELEEPLPRHDKLVGVWMDVRLKSMPMRLVIFERGGKLLLDYAGEEELIQRKRGPNIEIRQKNPSAIDKQDGLYWVLLPDKSLEWHGQGKLEATMPLVHQ